MDTTSTTTGLIGTLWAKLVAQVAKHSLKQIGKTLLLVLSAGLLSAAFIDGPKVLGTICRALDWHNAAVAKVAVVYSLVFLYRPAKHKVIAFIASFFPEGESEEGETIEGIPTVELIDHLVLARSLKRDECTTKFGVPQHRIEALGKKLFDIGVLVTGPNNAKVLCDDYSRQDLARIFAGKSSASELTKVLRPKDRHFTFDPSAKEIAERTPLLPARAPGFASRQLALAA